MVSGSRAKGQLDKRPFGTESTMRLNTSVNLDIYADAMKPFSFALGRYSRLALLLLMLAAQGITNAHELGDSHAIASDSCATCIIGHGLGTAVSVSHDAPQVQVYHAPVTLQSITNLAISRTHSHFARAPPNSP